MEFLYDHSGVFAVKYNNATYFYRKNAQQDVIELLDSNGTAVVKYNYDAWGNCEVDASTTNTTLANLNPLRYRSYYYDTETKLYFLKTRYYDPEIGRFMTIDDLAYLNPDSVNGLNLYAYCLNNPVKYQDPNGTSAILIAIGIVIGVLTLAGGIFGGISAGLNGGSVGDVFIGIGKGMLAGALLGGVISLAIGGFAIGATTVLGSTMVTYGISTAANYIEVAVTQGKKSYSDGRSFADGVNDIIDAMLANSPRILVGRFAIDGLALWGTRLYTKGIHISNIAFDTYELSQYVKTGFAFRNAVEGIAWSKAGNLGMFVGYGMTAWQVVNMIDAIFTQPDYDNSKWILY